MIPHGDLLFIRQRAGYRCEYCTVSEIDCGGELTVDHFWPSSKGGQDDFENLVYACSKCNLYKHNFYPLQDGGAALFNPRIDNYDDHFIVLENGLIHPVSSKANFTIKLLRLNRKQLISYRINKLIQFDQRIKLAQLHDLTKLLNEVNQQLIMLNLEQQKLLREQNTLLNTLLNKDLDNKS